MRCCAMSLNHGFWRLFVWIWALLGFRRDFPKIHDNVDVVRVANEMKPCGVKNLSSTIGTCNKLRISLSTRAIFCSRLFLDLWIYVDRLCKCIVDKLYGYFWIYESVLTCCANVLLAGYLLLIGYFWIYEYVICVF